MNKLILKLAFISAVVFLSSCGGDSSPGFEFMPNMYHPIPLETYAKHNIKNYNGMPVKGTISRDHLPTFPYNKCDTCADEGYLKAGREAVNPIENNDDNLKKGAKLYTMMCSHCHGKNGEGKGTIKHPAYSAETNAVPSYKDTSEIRRSGASMSELNAGHIFHTITYGLNAMGPHASQVTEEERWLIVNYIQEKLQN
tara:strand:+ start:11 stop:601 length:591 start_codon:yes stop_codon:yes gene_type:complete